MGREIQKKKRRSNRPVVKTNKRQKVLRNPTGNTTIAKNWNTRQTFTQNYTRLGLLPRLNAPTGGVELHKRLHPSTSSSRRTQPIPFAITPIPAVVAQATVSRDSDGNITGILSVGGKKRKRNNPLNDPLNELESDSVEDEIKGDDAGGDEWDGLQDAEEEEQGETTSIVKQLEYEATLAAPKVPQKQSTGEQEWLERLFEKHGDDVAAMVRDKRLNVMQQTHGDIKRRLTKWKVARGLA